MIPDWQIIQYTNQLRENISLNPAVPIPDIDQVIADAGYQYVEESFGNDFSAFSRYLGSGNFLIGFNKDQYWNEKFRRFTLAHELGHLTIPSHRSRLEKETLHRSKQDYSSNSRDPIETEADKFAINFLAPQKTFHEKSRTRKFNTKTIEMLSDYFNISTYAAALHFVEVTDLACVLIVTKKSGQISYEKRSKKFYDGFYHPFIHKQKVPSETLCYDFIHGDASEDELDGERELELNLWYPELKHTINASESVIDLEYNDLTISLIEPHKICDEDDE